MIWPIIVTLSSEDLRNRPKMVGSPPPGTFAPERVWVELDWTGDVPTAVNAHSEEWSGGMLVAVLQDVRDVQIRFAPTVPRGRGD